MSAPKRRPKCDGFLIKDGMAVRAEYQPDCNRFVFLVSDGSCEVVDCGDATPEQIETFIADVAMCVPVIRKYVRGAK
jgi:hypothetical protein